MKLDWSEPALASLQALHDCIAHDSPAYARVFVHRLLVSVDSLRDFPGRGRHVPEMRRSDIREILFQNQRVIYRVEAERVVILAIVHAARDLGRLPRPPWEIG